MKKIYFTLCLLIFGQLSNAQVNNVGIGTTTPDPSAILDLQSTDQGFLLPRMDQSGENALPTPAQGLMIFNTDVNNGIGLQAPRFYNGSLWNTVLGQKSNGEILLDNGGINYFNTTGSGYYQFRTNNTLRMAIFNNGDIQFNRPDLDNSIFIFGGNHITARSNDWTVHKDLYLNYDGNGPVRMGAGHLTLGSSSGFRTVFYEDGNVQFTKPGWDNSLLFLNGHHIQATSEDWATKKPLYLNYDGGEIRLGPGNFFLGGTESRIESYADGNVRFHKPGSDENLYFFGGNHIAARGNDWATPRSLYIQDSGGNTYFGPGDVNFAGAIGVAGTSWLNGWANILTATIGSGNTNGYESCIIYGNTTAQVTPALYVQNDGFNINPLTGATNYHPSISTSTINAQPGGGLWWATSDIRAKQDIKNYSRGLAEIRKINTINYRYNEKSGYHTEPVYTGIIAQELQEIAPEMVIPGPTSEDFLTVNPSAFTYMLINAVQEQDEVIQKQEDKIEDLETRLARLEALLLKKE